MVAEVCEPFPVAALPEPLQSFVKNTAAAIGCDPAMVAVPILVAVAAAVGTTRRVEVKPGYFEVCILWAMIIARRGGKKSPALQPCPPRGPPHAGPYLRPGGEQARCQAGRPG